MHCHGIRLCLPLERCEALVMTLGVMNVIRTGTERVA